MSRTPRTSERTAQSAALVGQRALLVWADSELAARTLHAGKLRLRAVRPPGDRAKRSLYVFQYGRET